MTDAMISRAVESAKGVLKGPEDSWSSPRNVLAFVVVAIFAVQQLMPYWLVIPEGRTGDLISTGAKTVETILVLVLGYYFGSSQSSSKKDDVIARVAEMPVGPTTTQVQVDPGPPPTATITTEPAARTDDDADLPPSQRVNP